MEGHIYPMGVHRNGTLSFWNKCYFSKIISFAIFHSQRASNPMNFSVAENNFQNLKC